ncbi:MAG: fumarylacetoacetate hydrolase family protein [Gammaproteobacteria bacterium]|nr:fumarylacetoacetate hydrolase family protein [Gammaproteobacteria bacterium]
MKLASLKSLHRDGVLVVVNKPLTHARVVVDIAPTLQQALDNWEQLMPRLNRVYQELNAGHGQAIAFKPEDAAAPLPRAYQWLDGSAYLSHVKRVRNARGAELPGKLLDDPLMYQGGSDGFLGAHEPIEVRDESFGIDFEAEVGVITDDVESGISDSEAATHIKLLVLINDISLRHLIPDELSKGFGFVHGKPASAFSPVAVTPDELDSAWRDNKLHFPLKVYWNQELFGQANAGDDMQFSFARLISHAAKTRNLGAGTIIGSGTVSNQDLTRGYSCIVEKRVVEIVESGKPLTDFMHFDDTIRIEMQNHQGHSIFGAIDQTVKQCL